MHSPPALARQRLMKHVAREKKAVPVDPLTTGQYAARGSFGGNTGSLFEEEVETKSLAGKILPWAGWALAAGMAALAVNLHLENVQIAKNAVSVQDRAAQTQVAARRRIC